VRGARIGQNMYLVEPRTENEAVICLYKYTVMYQTQQNFIMFIIVLGQHVSILIESSSGPSKMQILT